MKLSIIIPVYNEEWTILEIIRRIEEVDLKGIKKEIIIIDDGSTDNTNNLLNELGFDKVIHHDINMGKSDAIKSGLRLASGDIILIQDADLEYNPEDYPNLIKPVINDDADIVYGYRLFRHSKNKNRLYYAGNQLLTFMTNLLYNARLKDMETCYKLFKLEVIKGININSKRFGFEPEITAKILKKGYDIIQVPIHFNSRRFSDGKKIRLIDGVMAVWYLLKYRFID